MGIAGWGMGRWVPGWVIPVPSTGPARSHPDSEAGPVRPCRGLEWVVRMAGASELHGPPLPAVGPAPLSMYLSSGKTPVWANKGEIP